jgi:hypothetical protein
VISPIGPMGSTVREEADAVLEYIIEPALAPLGIEAIRSDKLAGPGLISQQMVESILDYDFCIADLSGHNPNVFYELAIAQAAPRPVILMTRAGREIPFDVKDYRVIEYDLKPKSLKTDKWIPILREHVRVVTSSSYRAPHLLPGRAIASPDCIRAITADRRSQSQEIANYIERNQPHRVNVLQVSMLAIVDELLGASAKASDLMVAMLLMHPEEAARRYTGGAAHAEDVRRAENLVRRAPGNVQLYRQSTSNTLGLWYYRHEPSLAAVMVDDDLLQLGWYLREPDPRSSGLLRLKGHDQPAVLFARAAPGDLRERVWSHFQNVWGLSELVCTSGPRAEELEAEWRNARERPEAREPAGVAGTATMPGGGAAAATSTAARSPDEGAAHEA